MTRTDRQQLLRLVRAGYPLAAACAKTGVSLRAIRAAGVAFQGEINEAYEVGTAALTAAATAAALDGDNRLLAQVLAEREQGAANGHAAGAMTLASAIAALRSCSLKDRNRVLDIIEDELRRRETSELLEVEGELLSHFSDDELIARLHEARDRSSARSPPG